MRNRVLLHRFNPCRCGAPARPITRLSRTGVGRTFTRYQHAPACRIGVTLALAAGPRQHWYEPLPVGDKASGAR